MLPSDSTCTKALMVPFIACKMSYVTNVALQIQKALYKRQIHHVT